MSRVHEFPRKSGLAAGPESKETLSLPPDLPAQFCAQHCASPSASESGLTNEVLGEPLDIQAVAKLIGCSAWTVRQKYVPSGLPHLRSGPNGKLLFYKNQVVRWLLRQQQKGGVTL